MQVTTIGLDIAKHVFQVHGIDAEEQPVIKRRLRRSDVYRFFAELPPCVVGLEACATAHHWARELTALGHQVRLMPPQYVRPFVKRNKNDAADAEAICEAVTRPTMRFASLKYVLTLENSDPQSPRYEPYGIAVTKRYAYDEGCRPVLYLSDAETTDLQIPRGELWRVVRFEVSKKGWISWLHEREWRCKGNFTLPRAPQAVFVRNTREAERLTKEIAACKSEFRCRPRAVVPLTVLCQGLLA